MFKIFISHKHSDKTIANELKDLLLNIACPGDSIFFSSDPRFGLDPGVRINKTLVKEAKSSDLLLLIYTDPDQDWTYPIHETTWAMASETRLSKIVVLSLHGHKPTILDDKKIVNLTKVEEIYQFIECLATEPDFLVPDVNHRKSMEQGVFLGMAKFDPELRKKHCSDFFTSLQKIRAAMPESGKPHYRMDYLRIKIPTEVVKNITENNKMTKASQKAILEGAQIVEVSDNSVLKHFGINNLTENTVLERLFTQWKSERKKRGFDCPPIDLAWQDDFVDEIWEITKDNVSRPSYNWQKGIQEYDLDHYYQMLIVKSEKHRNGKLYLDVYINEYRDRKSKPKK